MPRFVPEAAKEARDLSPKTSDGETIKPRFSEFSVISKDISKNKTMSKFVTALMSKIYSSRYMATHKMTGKGGANKKVMDPNELAEIVRITKLAYKNATIEEIRLSIRQKFNNEGRTIKNVEP